MIAIFEQSQTKTEVERMDIVRTKSLLEIVQLSYHAEDWDENLRTTSAMIRPSQHNMIRKLARANRMSQGDIIRIIIDDWSERVIAEKTDANED